MPKYVCQDLMTVPMPIHTLCPCTICSICMPSSVCQDLMKAPMPIYTLCPCTHLQDLYAKICGVSYIGDVRMGFAEDSRKIERIASGSAEGLALMYNKRLQVGTCSCQAQHMLSTVHPCTHTHAPMHHTATCVWLAAYLYLIAQRNQIAEHTLEFSTQELGTALVPLHGLEGRCCALRYPSKGATGSLWHPASMLWSMHPYQDRRYI